MTNQSRVKQMTAADNDTVRMRNTSAARPLSSHDNRDFVSAWRMETSSGKIAPRPRVFLVLPRIRDFEQDVKTSRDERLGTVRQDV